MQAAYDAGDRKALADVLTPEMLPNIDKEIAERGTHVATDVTALEATVLEVATEGDSHWASVHFQGTLREDGAVLPKPFDEVWNLVKPVDGKTGWLLAGIRRTGMKLPDPAAAPVRIANSVLEQEMGAREARTLRRDACSR